MAASVTGFNTQPPKGGWVAALPCMVLKVSFNTQPPKGGWTFVNDTDFGIRVSTRSRLKAAGKWPCPNFTSTRSCFNTQPPKGGWVGAGTANPYQ